MSLKSRFKSDSKSANDGVWFEFEANADGTLPAFKLARQSIQNKKYRKALRDSQNKGRSPEMDVLLMDLFLNTVLVDWRNLQPEDDGVVLEYSEENAKEFFKNEDWTDLYTELSGLSVDKDRFTGEALSEAIKN